MRAVVITEHGGPEVLRVEERPDPIAGPDEVVVDVAAAGLNFAEVMARLGLYPDAPKPPCVVGYEVAGTIAGTGERVMAGTRFGGHATKVAVRRADTLPLPDGLSFEQGAAIPVNYATAWAALVRYGNVQPGERVLINAAAGGVGIAATQIAKDIGAEVWGAASPGKHEAIRALGVDHPVDYTRRGWRRDVGKLDLVMDALGGRSLRGSYGLLRAGGRVIAYGAAGVMKGEKRDLVAAARTVATMPRFNLVKQMSESKAVIGLNLLTLWDEHGSLEPWMTPLGDLLERGVIQPVIAETFAFDRAGDAHRYIAERRNVGKVVLVP